MFESITESLQSAFARFRGTRLTESNIQDGLRQIRQALLEADVHFMVAKDLIAQVTERAVGEQVIDSVRPEQQIVKIFQDVLTDMMGSSGPLQLAEKAPTIIMLCGLQGSGKTTTAGKLARLLKKRGRNPALVAADLQRPAAIEQVSVLAETVGVPVYRATGKTPPELCAESIDWARENGRDIVILDTAGRLHIDDELMDELAAVKAKVNPHQTLFVCDSMTGQDAVNSARTFHERLDLDGVVMTKLDGDTRGGAAISIRKVTGAPIRYVGVGEKLEDLEEFHADRMASRILGMGDVVSLVEKAQDVIDEREAEAQVEKLLKDEFTFEDFLTQLRAMKKLGPMKDVLGMMPGMGSALKDVKVEDKALDHIEAIICSMTVEERLRPKLLNGSRRKRIANGSGTSVEQVNALAKQYDAMRKMMKQLKSGGLFGRLAGRMMPGGGKQLAQAKDDGGDRRSEVAGEALSGLRSGGREGPQGPPQAREEETKGESPAALRRSSCDTHHTPKEVHVAVRIRLKRMGRRNRPFWRVCVFDSRTRRDGRSIEDLGFYDTLATDPTQEMKVDVERARHWLASGAKPSEIVYQIFKKTGVYSDAAPVVAAAAETPAETPAGEENAAS